MPKTKPKPISQSEAARRKGVTRSAVSRAVKAGGPLHGAVLPSGRLDASHPDFTRWLDAAKTKPKKSPTRVAPGPTPVPPTAGAPASLVEIRRLRLEQVDEHWGSAQGLNDYLAARKLVADVARLETNLAVQRGELISRELVRQHVFGWLEAASMQFLQDAPKTTVARIASMVRAGSSSEDMTKVVTDINSGHLKHAKNQVLQALRAKPKETTDDAR